MLNLFLQTVSYETSRLPYFPYKLTLGDKFVSFKGRLLFKPKIPGPYFDEILATQGNLAGLGKLKYSVTSSGF
jgi:hypothetical protein